MPARLGLQTGVEPGLAQHHRVAAVRRAASSNSSAAPQPTATVRTGCSGWPTICSRSIGGIFSAARQVRPSDERFCQPSPSARASDLRSLSGSKRAFRMPDRESGTMARRRASQVRSPPLVPRGPNRTPCADCTRRSCAAIRSNSSRPTVVSVGQSLRRRKRHRMMRDDQIGFSSIASAALAGVTVRQVISFRRSGCDGRPAARRCPTPRPDGEGHVDREKQQCRE